MLPGNPGKLYLHNGKKGQFLSLFAVSKRWKVAQVCYISCTLSKSGGFRHQVHFLCLCTVQCAWHNCVSASMYLSSGESPVRASQKFSAFYFSGSLSLSSTPLSPWTPSQAPTSPSPRNVSSSARKQFSRQWWDTDCAGRRPLHGLQEKSTKLFLVFYPRIGWALLPMWTCCLLWQALEAAQVRLFPSWWDFSLVVKLFSLLVRLFYSWWDYFPTWWYFFPSWWVPDDHFCWLGWLRILFSMMNHSTSETTIGRVFPSQLTKINIIVKLFF